MHTIYATLTDPSNKQKILIMISGYNYDIILKIPPPQQTIRLSKLSYLLGFSIKYQTCWVNFPLDEPLTV